MDWKLLSLGILYSEMDHLQEGKLDHSAGLENLDEGGSLEHSRYCIAVSYALDVFDCAELTSKLSTRLGVRPSPC